MRSVCNDSFAFYVTGMYNASKQEQLINFAAAFQRCFKTEEIKVESSWILAFNYAVINYGWENVFYAFTGRKLIAIFGGILTVLCISRIIIKMVFENALVGDHARRTLIYGTHAGAIAITNEALNTKPVKFVIDGYIGDSKPHYKERLMGRHIYSTREDLAAIIRKRKIEAVMVSPLKHDLFLKNRKLQDLFIEAGLKIYVAQSTEKWDKDGETQMKVSMREVKIEDLLPREEIKVDMDSGGC